MKTFQKLILIVILSSILCDDQENTNHSTESTEKEEKFWPNPENSSTSGLSNEECVQRIYRDCNYPTTFTDEELENVRQFLNYSFTVLADIKPDKPLCPKLHVRQDWKCLSQQQKRRVINVWKQMYENGIIQRLTDLHVKTWPAWHKSGEFLPSHRWFTNEFEKAMRFLDPRTTLPYWNPFTYGTQPERSSIWDTLGHSGNYSNGYSVSDGIYAEWALIPSMKRHWSPRGTIYPWFTQEFVTSLIQTSNSFAELTLNALGLHFPPHLNIGGYEGQYSVRDAPYDDVNVVVLRWQLLNKHFLTPLDSMNAFNQINGSIQMFNILTDTLTGAPTVTIRELFWVGFGDLCYIPDQLVRPINNLWKGKSDPIPTAVSRLPQWVLERYFPLFYYGNFTALSHTLEEVGDCNTRCEAIPKPTFMIETENGRRQLEAYSFDEGLDLRPNTALTEQRYYQMWLDLNRSGYCSPYVTTY